jgi:hypothetical protein
LNLHVHFQDTQSRRKYAVNTWFTGGTK